MGLVEFIAAKVVKAELVSSIHSKDKPTYWQPAVLDKDIPLVRKYVFGGNRNSQILLSGYKYFKTCKWCELNAFFWEYFADVKIKDGRDK